MDRATEAEMQALSKFKKLLQGKVEENEEAIQDDVLLLRFLRARELNLQKAEDMLIKAIAKKNSEKVKELENHEYLDILRKQYSIFFTDYDFDGRPVYFVNLGVWPLALNLYKAGFRKPLLKSIAKGLVYIVYKQIMSTKYQQFNFIVDLQHLTYYRILTEMTNLTGIRDCYRMFQVLEANFPDILHKFYFVNAPKAFLLGFNLFKSIFNSRTLNKIEFYYRGDFSYKEEFDKTLPPSCIPSHLSYKGSAKLTNIITGEIHCEA